MAQIINSENFEQLVATGKPIVLDFWATWCGPCKRVGPIIEALAQDYEGQAIIGKCDVEEDEDMAVRFGVRNIPTVFFIKGGEHNGDQTHQGRHARIGVGEWKILHIKLYEY